MKWIRPQDELPEAKEPFWGGKHSDDVLLWIDGRVYIGHLKVYEPSGCSIFTFIDDDYDGLYADIKVEKVTCWAPIAPPPKEWLNDEEEPPA